MLCNLDKQAGQESVHRFRMKPLALFCRIELAPEVWEGHTQSAKTHRSSDTRGCFDKNSG